MLYRVTGCALLAPWRFDPARNPRHAWALYALARLISVRAAPLSADNLRKARCYYWQWDNLLLIICGRGGCRGIADVMRWFIAVIRHRRADLNAHNWSRASGMKMLLELINNKGVHVKHARQEQIGCARPIGPRKGIQLAGKSTAGGMFCRVIVEKKSEIYKRNLTLGARRRRTNEIQVSSISGK